MPYDHAIVRARDSRSGARAATVEGCLIVIKVGIVGTNTSHAGVYAGILNAADGPGEARVTIAWSSGRDGLSGRHDDVPVLAAKHSIARATDDLAEVVAGVDAVLVLDDFDGGRLHGELARPFLRAGIPTFIDKPMALGHAEAVELFDLAEANGTPLLSASALRFSPEMTGFGPDEIGEVSSVSCVGPGDWYNYGVHAVEMACTIAPYTFGWLQRFAEPGRDTVVVGGEDTPTLVVQTLRDAAYVFHASAYGSAGSAHVEVTDATAFYGATMAAFVTMITTGEAPVTRAQTLQVLGILEAGERSAATGSRVEIPTDPAR